MNNEGFEIQKLKTGAEILTILDFDNTGLVRTFFTTRKGGVSTGAYDSLNFGGRNDDPVENILENRERVFGALGFDTSIKAFPEQVHEDRIACVKRKDLYGSNERIFPDTDAVITNERSLLLVCLFADCIPVFLFDAKNKVIGMVHAGWRGTRSYIAAKAAIRMVEEMGAEFSEIKAAIGPGISKACFEVEMDTYKEFKNAFVNIDDHTAKKPDGKFNIDLKALNVSQLREQGINNIIVSDYCTVSESELFYSYRRDNGITGRMAAGIGLL